MVLLIGFVCIGSWIIEGMVESVKCMYMELGGKVFVLIFDDVDIDVVVEGICVFGFYNVG